MPSGWPIRTGRMARRAGARLHRPCESPAPVRARRSSSGPDLMLLYPDPAYPDSYYYVDVARALAAGHGLNVDFVWIFAEVGGKIPADPVLPIPSNAHWLPLASFLQAPFIAVLGPTAIASALPMVLDRLARGAADLVDRPRRRRAAAGRDRRRRPRRDPGGRRGVHGPARELRDPPAARRGDDLADRPRAEGRARGSYVAAGLLVGPGVPRPQRRRSCSAGRSGSSSSRDRGRAVASAATLAPRLAVRGRRSAASPCSSLVDGPVVGPPARRLRLDLADDVRAATALWIRDDPASGTASPPTRRSRTFLAQGPAPIIASRLGGLRRRRSATSS